eukprot:CAMPEP_0184700106 /NCGR_PEP_ID=MMETSP0313-20130426/8700_1 /TAXON_ID=2792 /ORGANISM="Porphyridium aerugineum, Strain SAG 1380-2" /LENGTH=378 /DNA_ID=CAMNT_0027159513 /DNA_START=96 /DNA_END=1232 /DNA_ORIENTATION=+
MAFVNSAAAALAAASSASNASKSCDSRKTKYVTMKAGAAPVATTKFDKMRNKFGSRSVPVTDSAFSYDDFEKAMQDYDVKFALGDICSGKVVQIDHNGAFVDIGAKASAFLPMGEASMLDITNVEEVLESGVDREFEIISTEDANGQLLVSLKKIEFRRCWERLAQLQTEDVTVYATIESVNRGGAMVRIENLRGFVPGSHMSMQVNEDCVGTTLPLKFIEVDAEKGRVVLSHRRAMVQSQMLSIETGQVVSGVVRGVKPYGIFIDVNGMTGLLHISQISHDRVDDPTAVVKVNDIVKCMVISQDKEKGRISLSTKTLEPEPGDMLKDAKMVFSRAEEMAEKYHQRLEEERKAAADVADDIVSSLDLANLDDLPLVTN